MGKTTAPEQCSTHFIFPKSSGTPHKNVGYKRWISPISWVKAWYNSRMNRDDAKPIEIQAQDDPTRQRWSSPPNYLARATRWRLLLLTAALMLVLVLMREAGNPDNWAWMGFDRQPMVTDLVAATLADEEQESLSAEGLESSQEGPLRVSVRDNTSSIDVEITEAGEVSWRQQVWGEVFRKLSLDQRRQWFSLILSGRGLNDLRREMTDSWPALAVEIETFIHRRLTADWEAVSSQGLTSPEQLDRFSSWTVDLRDRWSQRLAPALSRVAASDVLDPVDRIELDRLMRDLAPATWSLVSDQTAAARPVEGPAWLVAWEQALNVSGESASVPSTTVYELLSQPEQFRSQTLQIVGQLQLVEWVEVPRNDLGIERYFVLWIKPRERSQYPYCVYIRDWPAELKFPDQRYTTYEQPISATAVFFKTRTFLAADEQLAVCPLLFARTAKAIPNVQGFASGNSGGHSAWNWTLIALMPIIAMWIAWRVYGSTRITRVRNQHRERSTVDTLERLTEDPQVKSPREHVAEFERSQNG